MTDNAVGKATPELFERIILRRLGAPDADVLTPPKHGVDVGVVRVAEGVAMALTTDPVFVVPAYGWERAAWFAVHILASDAATSGLPLRWMTVDLNLPPEITDDELTSLWDAFHRACAGLGIAIVTGHTARYDGCAWPMVGGATCIAMGSADAYVTPEMAQPGDRIVVTKGAAIEATALFAATFPDRLAVALGHETVAAADALFERMTGVRPARPWGDRDARRDRGRRPGRSAGDRGGLGDRHADRARRDPAPAGGRRDLRAYRHGPLPRDQRGHADRDGTAPARGPLRVRTRGRRDRRGRRRRGAPRRSGTHARPRRFDGVA
jgi:AIR synthase related protein